MAEPIRVLHVDDEPGFAELTTRYLEDGSGEFVVETATSAEEGLERLSREFDCVVSDYDMPETNGIEFLEAVRADHPEVPFILFTGKGDEAVASDAISAGVTDYLQKGAGSEQYEILANRIRNAVEGYRAQQAVEDSERRLRRVYERITDGFFAVDAEWRYTYVNEEGARLVGRSREELLGATVWEAFPEIEGTPFEDALRTAMESQETTAVEEYYPAHDTWYDVRVYPSADGISIYFQDVTDRKQRDRDRQLMEQVIREMNDAAVVVQDGVVRYTNPQAETLTGYDREELVGEPMTAFIAPEDQDVVQRRHEARLADDGEEPPEKYEIAVRTKEGDRVPVEINVSSIEYDGAPATVSLVRDVTDRKERERRLETVARRFEAIFDNPMTLIGILEPDGTLLEVNRTAMELVDASVEEVTGEPFPETPWWTHSAELQERLREWIDRAADGEHVRFEADHPAPDGRMGTVDGLLHPIRDDEGTVTELLAIGRDVTERKARERRLAEQKAKIETLHEVATEIEACESADAVYELIVEAAESVLEFDIAIADEARDDVLVPVAVSSAIDADQFYDETPVDAEDNLAAAVYRSGEPSLVADLQAHDVAPADPTFRSALTVPIGEYGVFQTVAKTPGAFEETDLELVELLVAHAREQLGRLETERQLRERTAELTRQNDRLEEFTGVVSHDLRNPLNVAQGSLEAARAECDSDHLDDVAYGLDRMEALVEDLLTLARQGERVREREPVDLREVAERCWQTVATADATLDATADATVMADPARLRQLLENLFRNAVEHGGEDVTITVGDLDDGFYVADDGPGIPEADRSAVFESGYSTAEDGTGFGLGIVERIVEAHGWQVRVTDSEAGGARFEVTGVDDRP